MPISAKPPKFVTVEPADVSNAWTLAAVSGGVLLLYSLSRLIALQRRVRDLEARPPVDDIVMRGMIRQQVSEMVGDLEKSIRSRAAIAPVVVTAITPPSQPAQAEAAFEKESPIKTVEAEVAESDKPRGAKAAAKPKRKLKGAQEVAVV